MGKGTKNWLTTDGTDFTDLNISKLRERRYDREPNAVEEENSREDLTANLRVMNANGAAARGPRECKNATMDG
jgi:hypothetical protein